MSIASFTSCIRKREHIYHFTPHDSLYFNAYDTLCYYKFETTQGVDSLWFNRKVCIDNYKKWYIDICPPEGTFDPIFYYIGTFIHNGCKEYFNLHLTKTCINSDPELSSVLGERFAFSINDSLITFVPDAVILLSVLSILILIKFFIF